MALETLKGVNKIGGFDVTTNPDTFDGNKPVFVDEILGQISFYIQKGPIKEVGVNGCQVDTLIAAAKRILEGLNTQFPCRENACAITKLDEALHWLEHRKKDRELRGVEGKAEA